MAAEAEKWLEAVQRTQISSWSGAEKTKEPQDWIPKRQSPSPATRTRRYALELWVEIEIRAGMYAYCVDFTIDALNRAYPGCTGVYLGEAGHMVAFYGKKANSKAGLIHDEAVVASKAILEIPTWMGHFARWRVKCRSISEASEIVAGCKRLEKENLRWARLELQQRISAMQVDSMLSTSARPFQPWTALHSSNEDEDQTVGPPRSRWPGNGPTPGLVSSSPAGRMPFHHPVSSKDEGHPVMPPIMTGLFVRGVEVEGVGKAKVAVTLMIRAPREGGERRKMDFLVKSKSRNLVVKRDILMMWPMPLGSGPSVSPITVTTMRIPTSCLS